MEFTLQAGDVLYLPRGWIHDARTFSTDSLHVTVGVQVPPLSPPPISWDWAKAMVATSR